MAPSSSTSHHHHHHQQQQQLITSHLSDSSLLWHHINSLQSSLNCPSCHSIFYPPTISLPCGHIYCKKCLNNLHHRCHICKLEFSNRAVREVGQMDEVVREMKGLLQVMREAMTPSRMTPFASRRRPYGPSHQEHQLMDSTTINANNVSHSGALLNMTAAGDSHMTSDESFATGYHHNHQTTSFNTLRDSTLLHQETPLTIRKERTQQRLKSMSIDDLKMEIQRIRLFVEGKYHERRQVRECIEAIKSQGVSALNTDKWPVLNYLSTKQHANPGSPSRALFGANHRHSAVARLANGSNNRSGIQTESTSRVLDASSRVFGNDFSTSTSSTLPPPAMSSLAASLSRTNQVIEYSGLYSKYDPANVIIITTGLDDTDKALVQQAMTFIGGHVLEDFCPQVTHVVASVSDREGTAKRTVKYACGVLNGCWIVNMNWIAESLENERWLNEKCFEVAGDSKHRGAPAAGRARRLANQPPIFHNVKIYFCGDFSAPYPPQDDLELIAQTGGAHIIEDIASEYDRTRDNLLLILGKMTPSTRRDLEHNLGVRGIHYTWLLDSCSRHELLPVLDYQIPSES